MDLKTILTTLVILFIMTTTISAQRATDVNDLSFYDRNSDGNLSIQELQVIEYDILNMQTTDTQNSAYTNITGETPFIGTMPAVKTPPPIIIEPIPEEPRDKKVVITGWFRDESGIRTENLIVSGFLNRVNADVTDTSYTTGAANTVTLTNNAIQNIIVSGWFNRVYYPATANPTITVYGRYNKVTRTKP